MSLLGFVLFILVALSLLAGLLRRIPWLAAGITAAGLGWLVWCLHQWPLEGSITLGGRTLVLDAGRQLLGFSFLLTPAARAPLLLLMIWGGIFALVAALARAERSFVPLIPLLVAALALFLSATPLLWAPFWLMVAAVLMGIMAQGNRPRPARAALRLLLAPTLAFPFFLFAAWVFSQSAIAAEDPQLWNQAWRALLVGMLMLASPVPLHGWIVALGESASPFAAAFLVGVWQMAVYAFLRHGLFAYPTLTEIVDPGVWLPRIAVINMLWAGVFMLGSQRLGQFWGYVLLWYYGAGFLVWGLTGELGGGAMFGVFLTAPLALTLAAAGLQSVMHRFGEDPSYARLHGGGERLPFSTLALVGGALFVLGWPLAALFPWRFATWQVASVRAGNLFLWSMLALGLAVLGVVRVARALTRPVQDVGLPRESRVMGWIVPLLLAIHVVLGLNPGLITSLTEQWLIWFQWLRH